MELFGALFSPFVRKVAVVAAEKNIALTLQPTNFFAPSADFLAASPFRKIPAIKDGDFLLPDSTAICAYFDALHPEPPIYPTEARAKARAVWFEEFGDTIMLPTVGPAIFNRFVLPHFRGKPGNEEAALAALEKFAGALDYLESAAPAEGWLAGEYSLGDITVASMLRTLDYIGAALDEARYPATAAWYARVCARPAWQAVAAQEEEAATALPA